MKTIKERAEKYCGKIPLGASNHILKIRDILIEAMTEQDKITRNACADNINYETCHIFDQGFLMPFQLTTRLALF